MPCIAAERDIHAGPKHMGCDKLGADRILCHPQERPRCVPGSDGQPENVTAHIHIGASLIRSGGYVSMSPAHAAHAAHSMGERRERHR